MNMKLNDNLDSRLKNMEEKEPLKLFVIGGIALIISLLVIGFITSREFSYFITDIIIQMGLLGDSVVPLIVVDVIRHIIASSMIGIMMWAYLIDLETTWLCLQVVKKNE